MPAEIKKKHNVLLVAYYYPPIANIGAQRLLKFAKYLPEFGFEPVILTVGHKGLTPNKIDSKVYRAIDPLMFYKPYKDRLFGRSRYYESMTKNVASKNRWSHFVARNLFVPEPQITWVLPALLKAKQIVKAENIEIVLTSSPPLSSHFVGQALKRFLNIPWVADFRDGWTFDPHPPRPANAHFRMALERRMERSVIEQADAVVSVTPRLTENFRDRFPSRSGNMITITNGFDEDDYREAIEPKLNPTLFHIIHTGGFSSSKSARTPYHFLAGLKNFLDDLVPAQRALVQVTFVGRLTKAEEQMIEDLSLQETVKYLGTVSFHEAVGFQMAASVLLLVTTPNETSEATGKLFEYLGACKPILALADANVAAEIIDNLNAGICVPPTDIAGISSALQRLFWDYQQKTLSLKINKSNIDVYSRRLLTKEIGSVFMKIMNP